MKGELLDNERMHNPKLGSDIMMGLPAFPVMQSLASELFTQSKNYVHALVNMLETKMSYLVGNTYGERNPIAKGRQECWALLLKVVGVLFQEVTAI